MKHVENNMPVLKCATKVCSGHVDVDGEWEENDYCSFVEAKCEQCLCLYWLVKRDGKLTVRDRDTNDNSELFDQRDSEIR